MPDTQGKRLEYARLRTAIRKGRGSVSPPEMTALLVAEGGEPMAGNSYWRWESGDRSLTPERAELIARVAGVDAAWLLMLSSTAAPEPEGYRAWLAAQEGAETTTPPHEEAASDGESGDQGKKKRRFVRATLPDETELLRPQRRRKGKRAG